MLELKASGMSKTEVSRALDLPEATVSCYRLKNCLARKGFVVLAVHFQHTSQEAMVRADKFRQWIEVGIPPREIAVLMPRQVDDYGSALMAELVRRGITSRNDSELQDLPKEPAGRLMIDYLTCLYGKGQSDAWARLMDLFTPYEEASASAAGARRPPRDRA
ncbi:hypothetical protein [Pseudomonas sp. CCOS 191]|uniref:hypothetical protein n=1 Tax=Pseudomonas sp. CCOS 191 TaxID=1649877 RepID=UPI0018E6C301|nr:hypothetical protein [Pseudomonas sp. CCOS 191]MBI6951451.1 hypothetical protein [Pseudomonas sp. CCOS 191]